MLRQIWPLLMALCPGEFRESHSPEGRIACAARRSPAAANSSHYSVASLKNDLRRRRFVKCPG